MLATNPFTLTSRSQILDTAYTAQTMYGIWRHSLPETGQEATPFKHEVQLVDGTIFRVDDSHATYEAMVARYCDDITWAIENIAEAARVEFADEAPRQRSAYNRLGRYASSSGRPFSPEILQAIVDEDAGKFYTYFIDDLVSNSEELLKSVGETKRSEKVIREGYPYRKLQTTH